MPVTIVEGITSTVNTFSSLALIYLFTYLFIYLFIYIYIHIKVQQFAKHPSRSRPLSH